MIRPDSGPVGSSCSGTISEKRPQIPNTKIPHAREDEPHSTEFPAKRIRVPLPDTSSPYFYHMTFDSFDKDTVDELIGIFKQKFPALPRASLATLPTSNHVPVRDSFIVFQIISSFSQCIYMQEKRWRFICKEILPDGTRGNCSNQLIISSYLPNIINDLPNELKVKTDWTDVKNQPIVVLSGFTNETGKFLNRGWDANLMCGADSVPQIILGTVKKPPEPFFVPDIPQAKVPVLAPSVQPMPRRCFTGYSFLQSVVPSSARYNAIAIVKSFFPPRPVNNGQSFMQTFYIIDASLGLGQQGEPFICFAYKPDPNQLPPFRKCGDVIIIRGFQVALFNSRKQIKLYGDSTLFAVLESDSFSPRFPATTAVAQTDIPLVAALRRWYEQDGQIASAAHDAKYGREYNKGVLEKESSGTGSIAALPLPVAGNAVTKTTNEATHNAVKEGVPDWNVVIQPSRTGGTISGVAALETIIPLPGGTGREPEVPERMVLPVNPVTNDAAGLAILEERTNLDAVSVGESVRVAAEPEQSIPAVGQPLASYCLKSANSGDRANKFCAIM